MPPVVTTGGRVVRTGGIVRTVVGVVRMGRAVVGGRVATGWARRVTAVREVGF
jgi:hypothetical protein